MKKISLMLATLTFALAACSQGPAQPPVQPGSPLSLGQGGVSYPDTQAAYDAQVMADLNRLGAQGVAPRVYLNVLPVAKTDDSVRAYVKSSFAAPVTCSVSWGDGSAATSVASPTVKNVETTDHAYATFGTYTITTTCLNGGAPVGTQSVTVQAGKKATGVTLDFDSPHLSGPTYNSYNVYQEKGFKFTSTPYGVDIYSLDYYPQYFNWGTSQGLFVSSYNSEMVMTAEDGSAFTLHSLDSRDAALDYTRNYMITGYKQGGGMVTASTNHVANAGSTVTFDSTWTNLTRVTFGLPQHYADVLIDNVKVSKAN